MVHALKTTFPYAQKNKSMRRDLNPYHVHQQNHRLHFFSRQKQVVNSSDTTRSQTSQASTWLHAD
jgi:hypothetical protein